MNLIMAVVWAAVGVGMLAYEYHTGTRPLTLFGTNISAAWLALLAAAYNFVRWWAARNARAQKLELLRMQQQLEEMRARRRREEQPPREPDPTFDFTDRPKEE
jgi:hypothetical protein